MTRVTGLGGFWVWSEVFTGREQGVGGVFVRWWRGEGGESGGLRGSGQGGDGGKGWGYCGCGCGRMFT